MNVLTVNYTDCNCDRNYLQVVSLPREKGAIDTGARDIARKVSREVKRGSDS